jgi:hypothetical protein
MSRPQASTRLPPAQHSPEPAVGAEGGASHGPVMIAFGSRIASGGDTAITRGSGTVSANSR